MPEPEFSLPYKMSGTVQNGAGRGRKLGFPTANLAVDDFADASEMPQGVFAACAQWEVGCKYQALANIGRRPTFGQSSLTVEVHILDFTGDLYGKRLEVELVNWLRAEQRFKGIDQLVEQIERDIEHTREILK